MPRENPPDLSSTLRQFAPLAPTAAQSSGVLKTRHGVIDFARRTAIMGVLNVTPDSFYDGGRRGDAKQAIADGVAMAACGADVIDIGGESTRPGAAAVSEAEELDRVLPVIRGLRKEVALPISIDTYKSSVARAALGAGADCAQAMTGRSIATATIAMSQMRALVFMSRTPFHRPLGRWAARYGTGERRRERRSDAPRRSAARGRAPRPYWN